MVVYIKEMMHIICPMSKSNIRKLAWFWCNVSSW